MEYAQAEKKKHHHHHHHHHHQSTTALLQSEMTRTVQLPLRDLLC